MGDVRALTSAGPPGIARRTATRPRRLARPARIPRRDLVAFPAGSAIAGTITVIDRLGDAATFTGDDLALLQTLTGHLAVAAAVRRWSNGSPSTPTTTP